MANRFPVPRWFGVSVVVGMNYGTRFKMKVFLLGYRKKIDG